MLTFFRWAFTSPGDDPPGLVLNQRYLGRIGAWLVSTLMWLPLFLPVLARQAHLRRRGQVPPANPARRAAIAHRHRPRLRPADAQGRTQARPARTGLPHGRGQAGAPRRRRRAGRGSRAVPPRSHGGANPRPGRHGDPVREGARDLRHEEGRGAREEAQEGRRRTRHGASTSSSKSPTFTTRGYPVTVR